MPEYEKRWARYGRPVSSSWRMEETAVTVRGGLHYLYRAVDKHGKSVGSLLRADRGTEAAQAFFREAVASNCWRWPTKVNLDGNAASHRALRLLGTEDSKWKPVVVRCCRYLNNIVEQDHRAIKRRCAPMLGLKSFETAAITFAGVELAHRIRKRQFSFGRDIQRGGWSVKQLWDLALAQRPVIEPPLFRVSAVRPASILIFRSTRRDRGTRLRARFLPTVSIRPPASVCWATTHLRCQLVERQQSH